MGVDVVFVDVEVVGGVVVAAVGVDDVRDVDHDARDVDHDVRDVNHDARDVDRYVKDVRDVDRRDNNNNNNKSENIALRK